jgi:uncharacterized protein (TIGR00255 family)
MAISSMTGFARSSGHADNLSWAWDVRSVNGKAFDLRLRLPPGFDHLETQVRAILAGNFKRGNFQASLTTTSGDEINAVRVNEPLLEQLVAIAEQLRTRLGGSPAQPEALLSLRGVLEQSTQALDEDQANLRDAAILESLAGAAKDLLKARRDEGARLKNYLEAQLNQVQQLSEAARDCPARKPEAIRQKLKEQLDRVLESSSNFDPDRLHQEAVVLATRNDIQEELDRLFAHLAAARDLLKSADPIGRKFDFLSQEFNREANTLCSKSNDRQLTAIGLELKTAIDQMREQIQNIE